MRTRDNRICCTVNSNRYYCLANVVLNFINNYFTFDICSRIIRERDRATQARVSVNKKKRKKVKKKTREQRGGVSPPC